jgi:hypothetical protein
VFGAVNAWTPLVSRRRDPALLRNSGLMPPDVGATVNKITIAPFSARLTNYEVCAIRKYGFLDSRLTGTR